MQDIIVDQSPMSQEVVAFRVAGQDFCCNLSSVREIRGWTQVTRLPRVEPYVKGVINLRGAVVPVIDLSELLGFGLTDPGPRHVIIIAHVQDQTVGLLAEVVLDILSFALTDLQPIPEVVETGTYKCISGVFMCDDRIIRQVELDRLLQREGKDAA